MTPWFSILRSWLQLILLRLTASPILIVERHGGIGDLLCVLPAAAALKARHPGARLVLFTARAFVPLAQLSGIADCVVASETRGLSWLRKQLLPLVDVYPLLPDELTPPRPRLRIPLIEEFARALGIRDAALPAPSLTPSNTDITAVKTLLAQKGLANSPLAIVHTGPTWPVKQWPVEHWTALASRLQKEHGMTLIQTGAEIHAGTQGAAAPRIPGVHDWIGKLTVTENLALISLAQLFIGVDSGLLHLACAAGTPALGLFGPTDPDSILPAGSSARGIKAGLDCIGCHHQPGGPLHWRTGCPREIQCMSDLNVEAVFQQCMETMNVAAASWLRSREANAASQPRRCRDIQ